MSDIDPRHLHISDFSYPLPDDRIAKHPLVERDHSKLLVYNKGEVSEDMFYNLPHHLPKGAMMVFNNTKVIYARLHFRKQTGALIEVFCLEPVMPADYQVSFAETHEVTWNCLIGNLKKWKEGPLVREVTIDNRIIHLSAERGEPNGSGHEVRFSWDASDVTFSELLEAIGELPIPPYLNRKTEESDLKTYQTVYSKIEGSVAAPTAGLHFTQNVLNHLDESGVERQEITLHVGAGTFRPVKSEEIEGHVMHSEWIGVRRSVIERLLAHDSQCIAVGTTSVRTLESLYWMGVKLIDNPNLSSEELHIRQWYPYERSKSPYTLPSAQEALQAILNFLQTHQMEVLHSSTQIIIAPGYDYKIVKTIVTNFHQPQSTLLLLVSAFVKGDWKSIYRYALDHDFRFLSYGDSCLLK